MTRNSPPRKAAVSNRLATAAAIADRPADHRFDSVAWSTAAARTAVIG